MSRAIAVSDLGNECLSEPAEPDVYCRVLEPVLERETVSILSPLRYPGSKRRLAGYIKRALELNDLRPSLFVEPFAGGASVALQLLNDGVVDSIGLIELDPLVAAFWKTAFFDADWLVHKIQTVEVTLERWYALKAEVPDGIRERALACLFLNRTSFSGILAPSSGPIGGRQQQSQYQLDCRFPRETLIRRIRQAEALKDRVAFIWNLPWTNGLARIRQMQQRGRLPANIFYYLDPPFFEKADRLYTYFFRPSDHIRLRDTILDLDEWWILSYDSIEHVNDLYADAEESAAHVEVLYSTSMGGGTRTAREVIISNLPQLPSEVRLWRQAREWKNRVRPLSHVPMVPPSESRLLAISGNPSVADNQFVERKGRDAEHQLSSPKRPTSQARSGGQLRGLDLRD